MKTIKVLFASLVISALSFSCSSSDDNSNSTGGDLTARWNQTKTAIKISGGPTQNIPYDSNEPGCDKDYVEFTDAGLLNDVVYFKNASDVCTADAVTPVTYTRTNNTLVISGGEFDGTYEIKKLTGSDLQLQQTSSGSGFTTVTTVYFTKASM